MTVLWLVAAVVTAAVGGLVGWPAWRDYRARQARDLNMERYLSWRGRASRSPGSGSEGPTPNERRRLLTAALLLAAAVGCLVAYLVTT